MTFRTAGATGRDKAFGGRYVNVFTLSRLLDLREKQKTARRSIEDVGDLIKSTNEDVTRTRLELLFFLGVIAFTAATTFSITDKDLLIGARVKLPLLELSIGLDEFLAGAPVLLLAAHFALLLKFDKLRTKCREISKLIAGIDDQAIADGLRLRVVSNFLTQAIISRPGESFHRALNASLYIVCLGLAPVLALFLILVRTLPLHRLDLTVLQHVVILGDIWLLGYFHLSLLHRKSWATGIAMILSILANLVFCIPDSWFDRFGSAIWPVRAPFVGDETSRVAFGPTAFLLESGFDETTGRPVSWFSRNLIVLDERALTTRTNPPSKVQPTLAPTDSDAGGENSVSVSLRGRDLRYGVFARSDFRRTDFTLADLSGASFEGADLRGVKFGCARGAPQPVSALWARIGHSSPRGVYADDVRCTILAEINLRDADLRGARFAGSIPVRRPSLAMALLQNVKLDGTDLADMDFTGADFSSASLVGTTFERSTLVGADFTQADLTGAILTGADLSLAALGNAKLDGADLTNAHLLMAELSNVSLVGTEMTNAVLSAARMMKASVWGSSLPATKGVAWADLSGLAVKKPDATKTTQIQQSMERFSGQAFRHKEVRKRLEAALGRDAAESVGNSENNELWTQWGMVLARSQDDDYYRRVFAEFLGELVCSGTNYMLAVDRWLRPDPGYSLYTYEPASPPVPRPDPALRGLRNTEVLDFGEFDMYPVTIRPIPEWIDLEPLIGRISKGDCAAVKESSKDFLHILKEAAARKGVKTRPGT